MHAITITLSPALFSTLFAGGGLVLVAYALMPRGDAAKQASFVFGLLLVASAGGLSGLNLTPTPRNPDPAPLPGPAVPTGEFATNVQQLFTGTKAEAQTIAALHRHFADQLEYDGRKATPLIKTTGDMGRLFAECQRYRGLSEAPFGDKFDSWNSYIAGQAQAQGVLTLGKSEQLDAARRSRAAQFYRDVAAALGGKS